MTNPVILLGTQSNGETLPVQVDDFGRLVAEGLQGPPGPEGPPGIGQLPPDPYEGALLGWLNGTLAWIGTPPVPIPEGVFGPITDWNSTDHIITVEGEIPSQVGSGVWLNQVGPDGMPYLNSTSLASYPWASYLTTEGDGGGWSGSPIVAFDGDPQTGTRPEYEDVPINFIPPEVIPVTTKISVWTGMGGSNTDPFTIYVNKGRVGEQSIQVSSDGIERFDIPFTGDLYNIQITGNSARSGWAHLYSIAIDDLFLVDSSFVPQIRVSSVLPNGILGVPEPSDAIFYPGAYLGIEEQQVAAWVLYGTDPTTRIDYLRQTRD